MLDERGKPKEETVELWRRDIVECVKELMGNPAFKDLLQYVPERWYEDEEGTRRIYGDMWTGEWWWRLQVCLCARSSRSCSEEESDNRNTYHLGLRSHL